MWNIVNYNDVKHITTEEYFSNNQYAVDVFKAKYCIGEESTPAEVFYRVANELTQFEKEEDQEYYRDNWFSLMWEGWFRPGGSILGGVGSNKKISLMNCTHIPIEGDNLEKIGKAEYVVMKSAAYRQGIGIDLSNLRPRGSKLGNAAEESTGIVPWGKKFSNVGLYVGQRGRMPALLESLSVSHPDIEEFITSKLQRGEIENANISVQITDDFMEALKKEENWSLRFDTEKERIEKTVDSKYLIDLIAETASQSAEPGVQFIDRMREGTIANTVYKSSGERRFRVEGTNACSEKPLPPYGNCNLLSVNMEMFSSDPEEFKNQLRQLVPFLVRLSDNVVSYELYYNLSPVEEQRRIVEELREVGLGITNLHGWFLKDNIQYDSDEAIEKAENFMKWYAYNVFMSSVVLGEEKGNAPAFDLVQNREDLLHSSYIRNIVNEFFDGDLSRINAMRNMAHMSVAPTGSLSSTFPIPCIASGIEPIIGPYYWRRTRAVNKGEWDYYFVIPDRIKNYLLSVIPNENQEDKEYIENINTSFLDNDGKYGLEFIEVYKKYISDEFFKFAHQVDYNKKVELLGKLYNWVDAAISCTFNLPFDSTHEDVRQIYLYAYEQGVRAVSVYREGSREGILIFQDPVSHKKEQSNKDVLCSERPEDIEYHCAPKRPDELHCNIHHTTVKGEKWLVLIGTLNGKPYELFAGQDDELALPKSVESGVISKNGKGKYDLNVKVRKREVEHKDIANVLMSAEQRALTRMISTCLRHGVPSEFITKQLKKSKEDITDFASAVSRVLSKYETGFFSEEENCPECGNPMAVVEGCQKCLVCGKTSKCE